MSGPNSSVASNNAEENTKVFRQSKFELAVALTLFSWPDLTLAVQNHWGGPDSAAKREWFAGAVVELFYVPSPSTSTSTPSTTMAETPELEDVETRLLQIMEDEFEVVVDDDSSLEVAEQIMRLWGECTQGDFRGVNKLQQEYATRGGRAETSIKAAVVDDEGGESVDDEEWDEEDGEEDVEMGDAPPMLVSKEKPAPEVDDEGFTRVVGKKRGR